VIVAVCTFCGITRSRTVTPGSDHQIPFTGDCPTRSAAAEMEQPTTSLEPE
jgi:hypothetical protein